MANVARAALLRTTIGSITVPPAITAAFRQPGETTASGGSDVRCKTRTIGIGCVAAPDGIETIGKDGQAVGFATQVLPIPQLNAGIVAMTVATCGNATMRASQIPFTLDATGLLTNGRRLPQCGARQDGLHATAG